MRALLLDVRGGDDLSGEMQPFAEVVETLGGEGVVVVLPREPGLDEAARVEGLEGLDHLFGDVSPGFCAAHILVVAIR